MVLTRSLLSASIKGLGLLLGRRNVVRLARFATMEVRLDVPNDMRSNGEFAVQRTMLCHRPPGRAFVAFDVGANLGEWTANLLQLAHTMRVTDIEVHAFEPVLSTFESLRRNLAKAREVAVRPVRCALSNKSGDGTMFVVGDDCGANSLHGGTHGAERTEQVPLLTVDDYCRVNHVDEIDLLKIDAEGHDMAVLEGAAGLLRARRIGAVQFEYNHRWVFARRYLKDVFDFISAWGYRIGKVTPGGIEFYPAWDFELETFREGNYLACPAAHARWFDQVRWWNQS